MASETPIIRMDSPLAAVTRQAGAVLSVRGGVRAPVHYGSAAAELGVCVHAVGLADRGDLGVLRISGAPAAVRALAHALSGSELEPTGVAGSAGSWWCAEASGAVLAICDAGRRGRLLGVMRAQARRLAGVEVRDVSADVSIIALVGPRTARVLATVGALGAGGDPRVAPPFAEVAIAGVEAHVLLQSDRRALVLVAPDKADRVWRALAAAGRDEGLSCVGLEAVERFAMLDRLRTPAAPSR